MTSKAQCFGSISRASAPYCSCSARVSCKNFIRLVEPGSGWRASMACLSVRRRVRTWLRRGSGLLAVVAVAYVFSLNLEPDAIAISRNFYGVLEVTGDLPDEALEELAAEVFRGYEAEETTGADH